MATATLVARLRRRLGDDGNPPAFSDAELSLLLDEQGGAEPRARLAALQELATAAAGRTDYTTGVSGERVSQAFDQLFALLADARTDVGAAAGEAAARVRAAAAPSVAVAVQVYF